MYRYIDCGYRVCFGLVVRSGTRCEKLIDGQWILVDILPPDCRLSIYE